MHPTPTDGQALSIPYQNLRHAMLAYLRKQVSDAAVAEDLLHEVFLKALAATQRRGAPHNLPGWLYTIARNTVIDYYRAKRPMEELPDELLATDPPDNVASQALANCLKPLAELLPPLYRDTLLATEFQGKTLQALATEGNVTLSAVKSRASRGRKLLKESLLACCQVEVSGSGEVLDFQPRQAAMGCAAPGNCV